MYRIRLPLNGAQAGNAKLLQEILKYISYFLLTQLKEGADLTHHITFYLHMPTQNIIARAASA